MPGDRWRGASFTKVYGAGPGKVTLVLPDGSPDPNAKKPIRGYYHKRAPADLGRITWYYCPRCGHAYDKAYKGAGGCYCKPIFDGHSEPVSWEAVPMRKMPDQEAAEAAFLMGGIEAVLLISAQLKEPDEPGPDDPATNP